MTTKPEKDYVNLNLKMRRDLHRQAKMKAAQQGITLTKLVAIAVSEYVERTE